MWRRSTVIKIIGAWLAFKAILLGALWVFVFSPNVPDIAAVPQPTPPPEDKIDRPTSDPYTGDLARFDREGRAEKLQIERVMDILKIGPGSNVADIGAGGGWFTVIAAKRVGDDGKVFAVDISEESVSYVRDRSKREGFTNIEAVLGGPDDPRLKDKSVDAVLILNTYHEVAEPVALLRNLAKALRKGALVGIIDREGDGDDHGIDPEVVKKEAARAGLTFVESHDFVKADRMDYFLVFSAP